jgi:hypothetical protein
VWLQEFAWLERDVPRKREERLSSLPPESYEGFCLECEPLWCFEVRSWAQAPDPGSAILVGVRRTHSCCQLAMPRCWTALQVVHFFASCTPSLPCILGVLTI